MRQIDAVLYDMDGTLLDTERVHQWAWAEAGRQLGAQVGEAFFSGAMGTNMGNVRRLLRTLYPFADTDEFIARKEVLVEEWIAAHGVPVLPGVYAAMGRLAAEGIKQGVCTSTDRAVASLTLQRAGIAQRLDTLVCGDDITRGKPDPQIFLTGAQRLNVPIDRCLVVEDSPNGAEAGLRSGALVVLAPGLIPIPCGIQAKARQIKSLWALPELVLGLEEKGALV